MRTRLSVSILLLTLCAPLLAACVRPAPTPPPTTTTPGAGKASVPDVLTPQERAEIFRQVWETVNEHYYDPTFRGLDWRAVGERYRPQAESAHSDAEFYGVFELMLAALRDGHTIFIPPRMPGAKEEDEGVASGSLGLKLGEVEGRVAVVEVEPGSAAERAGAVADMDEVFRLGIRVPKVYFIRGRALLLKGEAERAVADFTEAIRLDPRAKYYLLRAEAYRKTGREELALADEREAAARGGTSPPRR